MNAHVLIRCDGRYTPPMHSTRPCRSTGSCSDWTANRRPAVHTFKLWLTARHDEGCGDWPHLRFAVRPG
jgi:hypothetical protein